MERMAELARKLKVDLTPEIQSLGDNDAISNALVDRAIKLGRNIKDIDKELLAFPADDDGPPPGSLLLALRQRSEHLQNEKIQMIEKEI
jgi:hypothetical protein